MRNKPYLVGITGGIGSGKSVVCKIFNSLGILNYNADERAKWLMRNDRTLRTKIMREFGKECYLENGLLNTTFLAKHVFSDEERLQKLNAIVHPAVQVDTEQWVTDHENESILIKEAALLFETESYKRLDQTILVLAPKELRIARVLERDAHRTRKDVEHIMSRQLTDEEKTPLSDFVIHNDEKQSLIQQSLDFLQRLKSVL